MATSKTVYVISADDAVQHLGKIKEILEKLKQENRISGYKEIMPESLETGALESLDQEDMAILLLTNGLLSIKDSVEEQLIILKRRQPKTKIAEILVDNISYVLDFIAFPSDLEPIRTRADMDGEWNRIGEDLRDMFPKPEIIDLIKDQLKDVEQNSSKEPRTTSVIGLIKEMNIAFQVFFILVILWSVWLIIIYFKNRGYIHMGSTIAVVILSWAAFLISYWIYRRSKRKKSPIALQGEVRGFKERSETIPTTLTSLSNSITIWNFRLERYEQGKQLDSVPVEMRGQKFVGFINEGDTIKLLSNWQSGLHKTKKVFNITNGSNVVAIGKGSSIGVKIFSLIVIFIIIVLIIQFIIP